MGGKLGFNVEIYSAGTLQCHLADATWFIDVKHGAASAKAYVRNHLNSFSSSASSSPSSSDRVSVAFRKSLMALQVETCGIRRDECILEAKLRT